MKTVKLFNLALIFSFMVSQSVLFAQTNPNLYVIMQYSNESELYTENYDRLHKEIIDKYSGNSKIIFVSYNVSNDDITANTKGEFDWLSVYNTSYIYKGEEGIIIMDPVNKQVIARYNLDACTKDILKSIAEGSQIIARANQ